MKRFRIFAAAAAAMLLTGCTFGAGIDTLMAPPKLSVEQEQIYNALTDAAGSSISLKYPKSGKYLSAFIVADIDGDGGNEAVVFYEKNSLTVEENTLRMNILDKEDGSWRSVCDTPADGSEIERVMISKLGSNERVNLIIGSSLINRSEKNVSVYNYNEGSVEKTFSESYYFFDVTDLDGDSENEFLLLSASGSASASSAAAYKLDPAGKYHKYSRDLSANFVEFDKISYGSLEGGRTGLFIDAVSGTGMIQTDVIYMDDSGLQKVFATPEDSLATLRASGCQSADIDGDGITEIPIQTIAAGYEDASEGEQMKLTSWMFVTVSDRLERKYTSYYSINDGFVFLFPDAWRGKVTVRRDAVNDELVFCAYSNGEFGRELLRIYCAEDSPSREDRLSGGYMLLHTKGDSAYLAYIPQSEADDGLSLTAADAAAGFRLTE